MSEPEQTTNDAPATDPQPAASPGNEQEFKAPDGYTLIRKDEADALHRNRDRVVGFEKQFGKIKDSGFDSLDALLETAGRAKELGERNVNLDALYEATNPQDTEEDFETRISTRILGELTKREQEVERSRAEREHQSMLQTESKGFRSGLDEVLDGVGPMADVLRRGAEAEFYDAAAASTFPEGHPLAGNINPQGAADKAIAWVKSQLGTIQGQKLEELGDAANAAQPKRKQTPATSQGEVETKPRRPLTAEDRKTQAMEILKKRRAR